MHYRWLSYVGYHFSGLATRASSFSTAVPVTQAVISRLRIQEALVQSQVRPCGIFGRQSSTGAGFSLFPVPIIVPRTLHSLFYHPGQVQCAHLSSECQGTQSHLTKRINEKFWEELISYFPWYDTGHIENDASNNCSIVAGVFVNAVTFLPSRCLAKIGRFLPSPCLPTIRGYTFRHTD
jgi:hypothetical protein